MEDLDDPQLQRKIADIRSTLQKMGTSFTEDDTSEFGKSAFSSEDSIEERYKYSRPKALRGFTQNTSSKFEGKKPTEEKPKTKFSEAFTSNWNPSNGKDSNLKGKMVEKDIEIKTLKDINEELRNKLNELHIEIERKEIELNKVVFEKDIHIKAEEELKRALNETRKSESQLKKEAKSLRGNNEMLENEKKDLMKSLDEQKTSLAKVQKELNSRNEELISLRTSKDFEFESPKSPGMNFDPRKFDFQRLRIPDKLSPSPHDNLEHFTERNENSYKAMCAEAMKIVGVHDVKDFYPRLLHLRQYHSKYKKAKQVVERISDMMVQCSPEGTFKEPPSNRQIWRWITRLLEEYMRLKQSLAGDLLYKLGDLLEVQNLEDIFDRVLKLVKSKINTS